MSSETKLPEIHEALAEHLGAYWRTFGKAASDGILAEIEVYARAAVEQAKPMHPSGRPYVSKSEMKRVETMVAVEQAKAEGE